ncbi:MAG: citrate (Si)-synthase [Deltaproteobacteria bacterium]|nr:citrate (Si)-synthase [Deltaproteobacteria bacterium]
MAEEVRVKNTGLRGVTVADSKVSFIDGVKGVLIYRGYRIEELADNCSYMETCHLLLKDHLPTAQELAPFEAAITARRALPEFTLHNLAGLPRTAHPMDVLQAAIPLLAMDDPEPLGQTRDEVVDKAMGLIARFPTIVAAWDRIRRGKKPLAPDPSLGHAANFLYMLHGETPDPESAHDLDVLLTLQADHTFNASTFACREVVSTRAHIYAGVTGGIGALSGALHGGANAMVMKMLLTLEHEKDLAGWVKSQLEQGERIMGLGHAVYKTDDPRAKYLRKIGERLGQKTGQPWFRISSEVERAALAELAARGKTELKPNLDFNSAPVYYMLGIHTDLMTPVFAMSRIAGWSAHIIEEIFAEAQGKPALYRPKAEYVGDYCGLMGCEFKPLASRA